MDFSIFSEFWVQFELLDGDFNQVFKGLKVTAGMKTYNFCLILLALLFAVSESCGFCIFMCAFYTRILK